MHMASQSQLNVIELLIKRSRMTVSKIAPPGGEKRTQLTQPRLDRTVQERCQ
jgi:hypothetical protein